MRSQPDTDIAALFDPNFDAPEPAVVPPGALPPSWAAAIAAHRTDSPTTSTVSPASPLAWSQVPDSSLTAPAAEPDPTTAIDTDVPADKRRRGRRKRGKTTHTDAEFTRQSKAAATRAERARKAVRLQLVGVEGNITRTRTQSTAWFVQPPGPWNMRPVARQRRYIQNEALVLANLAEAGVTGLHRRLVRTPWAVRAWAQAHDGWAEPIPDVPGALSWSDYLRGQQHAMLWGNPTLKGRYWGIELPPRAALAVGLDTVSEWLLPIVDWPLLGRVAKLVRAWARTAFLNEQKTLADHLATIERILSGQGVRAKPATAAQMDYLLLRSASLGLPLDAEGVISGGGNWEHSDVAALEDLTDLELTPGDGYTTVRGQVGGRDYTGYAIVLTVGRMAPLPIPEKMLPWQVLGDSSGEPLEWSERLRLKTKSQTIRSLRRLTARIEAQFDHYTVEHDQVPPQELAEQHALAQRVISDIEDDHSGLSVRTEGWYRVLVVGSSPEDARAKVSMLQEMYAPRIRLEQEHGQYQLLREFLPGEPLANIAHCRRMSVEAVSAGMAAVGDRIGDRTGVVIGETASIAPRPAVWDLFAAHEKKHKSGLTPIVAVPGSGKTFLAGMLVYQAVRAGAYGVVLDPSGPLKKLAQLPEFRGVADVQALTGRTSRPGSLNPYRVIVDPRRDDPDYNPTNPDYADDADPVAAARAQYEADLRAAQAERISVAVSVLKMMLSPARLEHEWTETVLQTAANTVGGERHHNLREVLDAIEALGRDDENADLRTCARSVHQELSMMADLAEARVLFPEAGTTGEPEDSVDNTTRLTVLTMPGLQLPPTGTDPSQWTPQQRMAGPLMHMAAWLANRLVYELPRFERKVLFLDENKYLEQTGAGRTLNLRIARDSRKYKVRALVCSQLPDDYLGVDGSDDKSALTYEVIIGDLGGNTHAIDGALKLLNLPAGEGYEALLADLGGGGEDTLDEDTDTDHLDQARRFIVKMADDIELIRSDWTHFVHLAHVFAALDSRATRAAMGAPA
ncbi:ATP-binding protein (plasmid) [Rhodococcus aetherivorans]|uniref:ATP-binding protein n=1 Tax=Rhodococcus aetherivorans TaxID=191292 RepID=A0AA46SGS3_9NOCA|nr:ATP-binding protein [Rhodococcus aetherivorans]MDV6297081.1 ATP-binding protein [Rhodococcus aetherivorans]UYF97414.1 ATP-binding protein [Rhodococcus aetherivorans]